MLPAGGTVGILGGGQLGRMLAMSAAQLGYQCHIYSPEDESVAAEVCAHHTQAAWDDAEALARFADACDVVTYEFENVPVAPLRAIQSKFAPGLAALEIAQDRIAEKAFVADLGGQPAPFAAVNSPEELEAAIAAIGTPGILKTRRDGYDGKGQWRINSADDAAAIDLPDVPLVYEGFVSFEAEFSVILVRGRDGEVRYWDSAQNTHTSGILSFSELPASKAITSQVPAARELAAQIAAKLEYVGVLTCEFFATPHGPVFNEMAPRVHNSGHWSIEGAATSQFENHMRAVCGAPLGDTATRGTAITMRNLIGDDVDEAQAILSDPANHLHLYGKSEARDGRKMGHVTRVEL